MAELYPYMPISWYPGVGYSHSVKDGGLALALPGRLTGRFLSQVTADHSAGGMGKVIAASLIALGVEYFILL